jgi:hypothetical protein
MCAMQRWRAESTARTIANTHEHVTVRALARARTRTHAQALTHARKSMQYTAQDTRVPRNTIGYRSTGIYAHPMTLKICALLTNKSSASTISHATRLNAHQLHCKHVRIDDSQRLGKKR